MTLEIFRHTDEKITKLVLLALKSEFPHVFCFHLRSVGYDFYSVALPESNIFSPAEINNIYFFAGYAYAYLQNFSSPVNST